MHRRSHRPSVLAVLMLGGALLTGCAFSNSGDDDGEIPSQSSDADHDNISDSDEGRTEGLDTGVDTDGDGTPDYLDTDSDNDGLTDALEAGDASPKTGPVDTDHDGVHDFRDKDSDNNGRTDDIDGTADLDNDGHRDYADEDDDGDHLRDIVELGDNPLAPVDTDGDRTPDFRDSDSDADTIADVDEMGEDLDGDGKPSFRDTDADGDCRPDVLEAGGVPPADTDGDRRPDFLDRDSDDDGIADHDEDLDCDAARDPNETDARNSDTDGDGAPDLVERSAKTDPIDGTRNPQAEGNFVFVVPFEEAPSPADDDLDFKTKLKQVDLYVLLDRSRSMSDEIGFVKDALSDVVRGLVCPANNPPPSCLPDLWAGAGTIGYVRSEAYGHHVDISPTPTLTSVPITEPLQRAGADEATLFAMWASITGNGSVAAQECTLTEATDPPINARTTCDASAAKLAGYEPYGYPCFRKGALPVILLATDEPSLTYSVPGVGGTFSYTCPSWNVVQPALERAGAKVIGVLGVPHERCGVPVDPNNRYRGGCTDEDVKRIAGETGAIDADTGAELVVPVVGTQRQDSVNAILEAVRSLAKGLPLDLSAHAINDSRNPNRVDAVASFIDHLETLQTGLGPCTGGLMDRDTDGDQRADRFERVKNGVPVCWKLVAKRNRTVPAETVPTLYHANVEVRGDGVTTLDRRDVYFLVPPRNIDDPVK